MKKKEYIKPELNVYQMETTSILAGSEILKAKEDDNITQMIPPVALK